MPDCPQCGGQVARGVDFCDTCGTYLDWSGDPDFQPFASDEDGSGSGSGAPQTARPVPQPRPAPPSQAAAPVTGAPTQGGGQHAPAPAPSDSAPTDSPSGVTLQLAATEVAVEPGGAATVELRLRNLGSVVDEFAALVEGPPGAWTTIQPPRVQVYPAQDAHVTLTFSPPRDGVPAGRTPFRVVARSTLRGGDQAWQEGALDVAPVTGLDLDVRPERQQSDRLASYEVVLRSRSNHPVVVDLEADEPQYRLELRIDPMRVQLPPFGGAVASVHAGAPGPAPDDPRPFPFTVLATFADQPRDGAVSTRADAVFVHRFAPPAAYLATLLGWLIGGLVVGMLLGGAWLALEWGRGIRIGGFAGVELPVAVIILGVTLGGAFLGRRFVRMRRGLRAGRTAGLLLVLTPLWAAGLVLAGAAVLENGSPAALVGLAILFGLLSPALIGRWIALRGTQQPLLPRPAPRRPSPTPATPPRPLPSPPPGPLSPPVSRPEPMATPGTRGEAPPAHATGVAPAAPGGPIPRLAARRRSPGVLAAVAGGLVVVGAAGAVAVYQLAPVPGEVVQDVNVRVTPDTRFAPAFVLRAGQRVSISCQVNGFGELRSPAQLEGGFVFLEVVDTYWPPKRC
jgi:hypothetical protein